MDYLKFGSGTKAFVLIPGLSVQSVMGSAAMVAEAYAQFAKDYTVYLFDRRRGLPASYSIEEMAEDTAQAIQALGLNDIQLVGASQGGMISMCIALDHPELVRKLVLCSTCPRANSEAVNTIEHWIALAREEKAEELYLSFGEKVYPKETFEQSRSLIIDLAATVTSEELDRFVILAEGIRTFDRYEDLKGIHCPVLAIGSRDDNVLGAKGTEEIAEQLSGHTEFEQFMYDGYGHAAYDLAPDYKNRIEAFLAK